MTLADTIHPAVPPARAPCATPSVNNDPTIPPTPISRRGFLPRESTLRAAILVMISLKKPKMIETPMKHKYIGANTFYAISDYSFKGKVLIKELG